MRSMLLIPLCTKLDIGFGPLLDWPPRCWAEVVDFVFDGDDCLASLSTDSDRLTSRW